MLALLQRMVVWVVALMLMIGILSAAGVVLLVLMVVALVAYAVLRWRLRASGFQGTASMWAHQQARQRASQWSASHWNAGRRANDSNAADAPSAPAAIEGEFVRLETTDRPE